jgi:hypothetical protein
MRLPDNITLVKANQQYYPLLLGVMELMPYRFDSVAAFDTWLLEYNQRRGHTKLRVVPATELRYGA